MPIYEYYCPDNHKIYSFYARTLAQGEAVPTCPDNPSYRMVKLLSGFAITGKTRKSSKAEAGGDAAGAEGSESAAPDDPRMDAAMAQMEREMEGVDENDPRAMGRLMRRMSELTGERLDEGTEEMVRRLEAGEDPEKLEEQMGELMPEGEDPGGGFGGSFGGAPVRDPHLYDY